MNKQFLLCIILLFSASSLSFAQITQNCCVKEYRGEKNKKPLPNVTIMAYGASTNVSDKNGNLSLVFQNLQAGDKVVAMKIEKAGYEIFNKDVIDNWRISRDNETFNIILCKSTDFKALKEKYYTLSSESYAHQLSAEKETINAMLNEGKIKIEEYEKLFRELQQKYEERLDNLDNYIDKFARIDLSEVPDEERKIVQMVQDGRIDDAIAAYEKLGLIEKIQVLGEQNAEIDQSITSLRQVKSKNVHQQEDLYSTLLNMINLLLIEGGRENIDKAMELQERAAISMPDNIRASYDCAARFKEQCLWNKAQEWYMKLLQMEGWDSSTRAILEHSYSEICYCLGLFDESEQHNETAQIILEGLSSPSKSDLITLISITHEKALLFQSKQDIQQAYDLYHETLSLCDSLYALTGNLEEVQRTKFSTIANLTDIFVQIGDFESAKKHSLELMEYLKPRLDTTNSQTMFMLAASETQYGHALANLGEIGNAFDYYFSALELFRQLYQKEPYYYSIYLANLLNKISIGYFGNGQVDKAIKYGMEELKYNEEATKYGGDEAKYNYAITLNNLGYFAYSNKQYDIAEEYYQKAISIDEKLVGKYYDAYIIELNRLHINMMSLYLAKKTYSECSRYDSCCMEEAEYLRSMLAEYYTDNYLLTYFNHGEYYLSMGDKDEALKAALHILEISPDYFVSKEDSALAGILYQN